MAMFLAVDSSSPPSLPLICGLDNQRLGLFAPFALDWLFRFRVPIWFHLVGYWVGQPLLENSTNPRIIPSDLFKVRWVPQKSVRFVLVAYGMVRFVSNPTDIPPDLFFPSDLYIFDENFNRI